MFLYFTVFLGRLETKSDIFAKLVELATNKTITVLLITKSKHR